MTEFLKRQTVDFYMILANALLVLLGMVFSIISSSGSAYSISNIYIVIGCVIVTVVLDGIIMAFANKVGNEVLLDILRWGTVIAVGIAFGVMVYTRAELMGFVWFSDLDAGNPIAISAMDNTVYSWICYGLALVCSTVSSFFSIKNK